jgi:hypothetical protein
VVDVDQARRLSLLFIGEAPPLITAAFAETTSPLLERRRETGGVELPWSNCAAQLSDKCRLILCLQFRFMRSNKRPNVF